LRGSGHSLASVWKPLDLGGFSGISAGEKKAGNAKAASGSGGFGLSNVRALPKPPDCTSGTKID
jgi:hypothetical protein